MNSQSWRQNWATEKCDIAMRLSQGAAGGSYHEAVILMCAVLSALASELWPGRGIDKARFVEMLVRLGANGKLCMTISVPLLVRYLESESRSKEADNLREGSGLSRMALVLTGPDIDKSEVDVLNACPDLGLRELRQFSYGSLLYQEVRSSYAHEYQPGANAGSWPMTMKEGQKVSYVNRLLGPGADQVSRMIHFHVPWLKELAVDLAQVADQEIMPLQAPSMWWIDGASG